MVSATTHSVMARPLHHTPTLRRSMPTAQPAHAAARLSQLTNNVAPVQCVVRLASPLAALGCILALQLLPQLLGIRALPLGQPALRVRWRPRVGGVKAASRAAAGCGDARRGWPTQYNFGQPTLTSAAVCDVQGWNISVRPTSQKVRYEAARQRAATSSCVAAEAHPLGYRGCRLRFRFFRSSPPAASCGGAAPAGPCAAAESAALRCTLVTAAQEDTGGAGRRSLQQARLGRMPASLSRPAVTRLVCSKAAHTAVLAEMQRIEHQP